MKVKLGESSFEVLSLVKAFFVRGLKVNTVYIFTDIQW